VERVTPQPRGAPGLVSVCGQYKLRLEVRPVERSGQMSPLKTCGTLVLSAVWLQRCRIAILRESLQDTVRVSHLPPAEPDSAQDSQSKVFTEAR
jgi:hypothetical protein